MALYQINRNDRYQSIFFATGASLGLMVSLAISIVQGNFYALQWWSPFCILFSLLRSWIFHRILEWDKGDGTHCEQGLESAVYIPDVLACDALHMREKVSGKSVVT
jgi:hypothetical protein